MPVWYQLVEYVEDFQSQRQKILKEFYDNKEVAYPTSIAKSESSDELYLLHHGIRRKIIDNSKKGAELYVGKKLQVLTLSEKALKHVVEGLPVYPNGTAIEY